MKFRSFGRTGFKTSEIGFGAWAIGGEGYGVTDDKESLKALEKAYDLGVNFFDTSDNYGQGHSEELIRHFLKGKDKGTVFIATKAGWNFYENPVKKCFEKKYIKYACEQSLRRLGIETIDLYQLHNPSFEKLNEELFKSLSELKKEGKIRFSGVSVHREEEALAVLDFDVVDSIQVILNLLDQRMIDRVIKKASLNGVAVIAREPLASGLLSGKYDDLQEFKKGDHRRRWSQEKREVDLEKIKRLREVLNAGKLNLIHESIEFVLSIAEVSVVIPGIKTAEQASENAKPSFEKRMSAQEIENLKQIFKNEPLFKKALNPS